MKRFHVHVGVEDLGKNIAFYSSLFGQAPAVVKDDYAKWMLDDPRINFAISNRGLPDGVDHLGFQTDTADELTALRTQTAQADIEKREDGLTACCYAKSDKYWVTDPQGIAWETFHTLGDVPTFNGAASGASMNALNAAASALAASPATACCAPHGTAAKTPTACC